MKAACGKREVWVNHRSDRELTGRRQNSSNKYVNSEMNKGDMQMASHLMSHYGNASLRCQEV